MLYQRAALALLTLFSLTPAASYAGAGGSPTAPAGGRSSDYCCMQWDRRTTRGDDGSTITFYNGSGNCRAISEEPLERNNCEGTVLKCRGEFFTPIGSVLTGGRGEEPGVKRCFTP